MIPILFPYSATSFTSHGLGDLMETIRCESVVNAEGEYELELDYPANGELISQLSINAIIVAKVDDHSQNQAFRIYGIDKAINNLVTVHAQHLTYDLSGVVVKKYEAETCGAAISGLKTNAVGSLANPFTITTDIPNSQQAQNQDQKFSVEEPKSLRSVLLDGDDSIKGCFGGDLIFDNYNVQLKRIGGEDRGTLIEYGIDLMDMKQEESISEMVTGVFPYWKGREEGDETSAEEKIVYGDIQYASGTFQRHRVIPLNVTEYYPNNTTAPSVSEINATAQDWIRANEIGQPELNLTVSYAHLGKDVRLHDAVTVRFVKIGIDVKAKVVSYKYDTLKERCVEVEVGKVKPSILFSLEDASRLKRGLIPPKRIANNSIDSDKLANSSVGTSQIADTAVSNWHLKDAAVDTRTLDDKAVTNEKIGDWAVTERTIGDVAITSAKIKDGAVTNKKIGDAAISSEKIGAGEIKSVNLGNSSVTSTHIANGSVITSKLHDASVTTAKVADLAIDSAKIGDSAITSIKLKDGSVVNAKLGNAAVTAEKVGTGAITEAKIGNSAVTSVKIANGSISEAKVSNGAITTSKLKDGSVTNAKVGALAIDEAKIGNSAITSIKIKDAAVDSNKIKDGAVINAKVSNGAISTTKVADLAIDEAKIGNSAITSVKIKDGQVVKGKVGPRAIEYENVENYEIDTLKLGNMSITSEKIGSGGWVQKPDGGWEYRDKGVEYGNLQQDSVESDIIAPDAVTYMHIGDYQVGEIKLVQTAQDAIAAVWNIEGLVADWMYSDLISASHISAWHHLEVGDIFSCYGETVYIDEIQDNYGYLHRALCV